MILDRYDPLGVLAILPEFGLELEPELAERRILCEEKVSAAEKLVSVFEPHRDYPQGQGRKLTEFGKKIWLSEVEGDIISSYRVLDGNPTPQRW